MNIAVLLAATLLTLNLIGVNTTLPNLETPGTTDQQILQQLRSTGADIVLLEQNVSAIQDKMPHDYGSEYVSLLDNRTFVVESDETQDEIDALLTQNRFNSEDFSQEATLQKLADTLGKGGSSITSFGRLHTGATRTQLDYASHYPFSPERLRLFLNGEREFVQYDDYDASKFVDEPDVYSMRPGAGDTMHIESAESATYIVGTEMTASFAFQINQSLQSGDEIRAGPYTGTDGWYFNHSGKHPNSSVVDIVMERGGKPTILERNVVLPKPLTSFHRYEVDFNWYNVGNQRWIQTYTENGTQINEVFAQTSLDGKRGPQTANLNLWYEVTAGGSTTDLEFEGGSVGIQVRSGADQLVRGKPQRVEVTIPAGDNIWHPVYAVRLKPNTTVNARLNELEVTAYGNNAEAELVVTSVSPSKTNASGWGVPEYHHAQNSVVQDTTDVQTVPNSTGHEVDPGSSDFKFGGWTVSAASIEPSGTNFNSGASTSAQTTIKRQVLESDVLVFMARSSTAGGDITFDYVIEQDY